MTQEERIKYADEIDRIEGMPVERIYNFNIDNLQKLTADFQEPLIRLILTRITTCEGQKEMVRFLKNKYEELMFYLDLPPIDAAPPDYFYTFEFELDCNRLITLDGSKPAPRHAAGSAYLPSAKDDKDKRIAELEAENEGLRASLKEQVAEIASIRQQFEECKSQLKAIKKQIEECDKWVVELFSHFCYEDEHVAREILGEIRGKEDTVIADIILERKQKNQISPKTQNRDLWRILHAAGLYQGTEGNFNTALRRRQQ